MLTHLSIHHLAVVEHLELDFKPGMTVMTGETGAGKSILIDALSLTLGARADSNMVRPNAPSSEVSALYDLTTLPSVTTWLNDNGLEAQGECIIRRVISSDGKSRAYINGRMVTATQLKQLSEQLLEIHGQHHHQSLLKSEHQRLLLDEYADHAPLVDTVHSAYREIQKLKKEQAEWIKQQGQQDKLTLLQYQIQEIDELGLKPQEPEQLVLEHKKLANTEQWLSFSETASLLLQNETGEDVISKLHQAENTLHPLKSFHPQLNNACDLLKNALIHAKEALTEIEDFQGSLSNDPNQLAAIDKRLGLIHATARKHRVQPEMLLEHRESLGSEAKKLLRAEEALTEIALKLNKAEETFLTAAKHLSESRQKMALILEKAITETLKSLELPHASFTIEFKNKNTEEKTFALHGIDEIEFLVSTNPGMPLQALRKIASGGELSRISLAICVITAQKMTIPTLIFDEVDVGVSGKTAEMVGKLLRRLGNETQTLCVTHLPQVASQAHHHYKVEKSQNQETTTTTIRVLNSEGKVQEIARLLGGVKVTKNALNHAEEMLEQANA